MKTYSNIVKQIEKLQQEAEAAKAKEIKGVVARIKEAIAAYGLTATDLGLGGAKRGPKPASAPVKRGRKGTGKAKKGDAPKFSDGNGNVWSGRGPRPKWIKEALSAGRNLEEFAHKAA